MTQEERDAADASRRRAEADSRSADETNRAAESTSKLTASQQRNLIQSLQQLGVLKDTNASFTRLQSTTEGLSNEQRKAAAASDLKYQKDQAGRQAFEQLITAAKGLTTTLLNASSADSSLKKYNSTIETVTGSASNLAKSFGIVGVVLSKFIDLAGWAAKETVVYSDNMIAAKRELSSLGAIGKMTTSEINDLGLKANYTSTTINGLIKPIKSLGPSIMSLGDNVNKGVGAFADMAAVSREQIDYYRAMGIEQDALTQNQADYVNLLAKSGIVINDQMKRDGALRAASLEYTNNLLTLSSITGQSIEQNKKQQEQARAHYEFQLRQMELSQQSADIQKKINSGEMGKGEGERQMAALKMQQEQNAMIVDAAQRIKGSAGAAEAAKLIANKGAVTSGAQALGLGQGFIELVQKTARGQKVEQGQAENTLQKQSEGNLRRYGAGVLTNAPETADLTMMKDVESLKTNTLYMGKDWEKLYKENKVSGYEAGKSPDAQKENAEKAIAAIKEKEFQAQELRDKAARKVIDLLGEENVQRGLAIAGLVGLAGVAWQAVKAFKAFLQLGGFLLGGGAAAAAGAAGAAGASGAGAAAAAAAAGGAGAAKAAGATKTAAEIKAMKPSERLAHHKSVAEANAAKEIPAAKPVPGPSPLAKPAGALKKITGFKGGPAMGGALAIGSIAADYGADKLEEAGHDKSAAALRIAGNAATGAAIGSMIPIVGTAVGALAGAAYGLYNNFDSLTGKTKDAAKVSEDSTKADSDGKDVTVKLNGSFVEMTTVTKAFTVALKDATEQLGNLGTGGTGKPPEGSKPPGSSGNTGGSTPGSSSADGQKAVGILMTKGWSKEQAAGIVGNLQQESGMNTKAHNKKENAQGIAQWRGERLEAFKKKYGKEVMNATLEEQLDFVDHELKTTEKKAGNLLKTAKSASDAAKIVDKHFERSAGTEVNRRTANAEVLMTKPTVTAAVATPRDTSPRRGNIPSPPPVAATPVKTESSDFRIADEIVSPDKPLSDRQLAVLGSSLRAGNQYPAYVMEKYNKQKAAKPVTVATATPDEPGVPTFAAGGIVSGPTMALLGESKRNPNEVVAPFNPDSPLAKWLMSPNATPPEIPTAKANPVADIQGITAEMISLLTDKFDEMIDKLSRSNDTQEQILKYSKM